MFAFSQASLTSSLDAAELPIKMLFMIDPSNRSDEANPSLDRISFWFRLRISMLFISIVPF